MMQRAIQWLLVGLTLVLVGVSANAEVWELIVDGEIGRGTVSYLRNGLAAAADAGARAVVITFSTPGGLLDAAVAARDAILDATVPTIAYVDREAFSAGALLAIACERVAFAPGGVLGAATPVVIGAGGVEEAPEKVVSATRALFAATADARGREALIAEAMVDPTVVISGLTEANRLLTLSAESALARGYSEGTVEGWEELLSLVELAGEARVEFAYRVLDQVLATLTSRWVAALLITVGLLGLIVEMLVPGFGVSGLVGVAALGIFFWSHVLVGLAGWESIALLLGGIVAVLLEVFVFTAVDFGVAGVAGLVLVGLGFYTAMVGPLTGSEEALKAVGVVSAGVLIGVVVAVVLITRLPRTRLRFGGVILSSTLSGGASRRQKDGEPAASWVGRRGEAATDLRPVGVGRFSGERADVVSQEGHLPKGTPIEVILDQGFRKVVRRIQGRSEQ